MKSSTKYILLVSILILFINEGKSQMMTGLVNSNYSGIYGLGLNPSSSVGSKLYLDVNFLGFEAATDNNYIYIASSDIYDIFKGKVPVYYTSKHEKRSFTYYDNEKLKDGFFGINIKGPGGMLVYGKHGFGLTTTFRSLTSFTNLPPDMATFLYEAIDYPPQQMKLYSHDKPISASSLSWLEIGINYSYLIRRFKWEYWAIGINLKPLIGYAGMYSSIANVDYLVEDDSTAYIKNANFNFGFSLPVNYNDNSFNKKLKRGFGFGVDIGVTYQKTRKGHSNGYFSRLCEQIYDSYNYKIGFSLLDFGYIKFNTAAEKRVYSNAEAFWYEPTDTLPTSTMDEITYKLEAYFGKPENFEREFAMYLPAAISLQYDRWMWKGFYLNGTVVYGFKFGEQAVKAPTFLSISSRWETAKFESSFTVSFYQFQAVPRLGFFLRYGGLFIGSDNLSPFLMVSDLTGLTFYAGFRLNLMRLLHMNWLKGNCRDLKMRNIETFDYRNF